MPLSPPAERDPIHRRRYQFHGFRRKDGLWDIEGHITDVKSYAFPNRYRGEIPAGEPIHDMWIRLTLDDRFVVQAIEAQTDAGPFSLCPAVTPNFDRIVGLTVGPGWRRAIRSRLGGVEGCTHLNELLNAMATAAFQTIYPILAREKGEASDSSRPPLIDSCHAFASDGEVVREHWPEHYTGEPDQKAV